jgi:hypothetical protein
VLVPLGGLAYIWRIALAVTTRGHAIDAVAQTQSRSFLGPGGPDDPFAAELKGRAGARTSLIAQPGSRSRRARARGTARDPDLRVVPDLNREGGAAGISRVASPARSSTASRRRRMTRRSAPRNRQRRVPSTRSCYGLPRLPSSRSRR